jgi:SAM-dependent methyltransferase
MSTPDKALSPVFPASVRSALRLEGRSLVGRWLSKCFRPPGGQPLFINLGCGTQILKGFINVDFFGTPGIDYAADLRYPFNMPDGFADGILCEHTLEHFAYPQADRILSESYRILKPGAVLRVVVPDLSIFIRNYQEDNREWFSRWERLLFIDSTDRERAQRRLLTPLEAISFVTQEYGHASCWDFPTMEAHMERTGFRDIAPAAFRRGHCEALLADQDAPDRIFVSLYVEAVK